MYLHARTSIPCTTASTYLAPLFIYTKEPQLFPVIQKYVYKINYKQVSPEKNCVLYFSPLKRQLCLAELGDYEAEKFSSYIEDQSLFPWVSFQLQ